VKRQVLRGVLDENLETVEGLPLGSLRRRRQRRSIRIKRWLLAGGGGVLLAVLSVAIWMGSRVDATSAAGRNQFQPASLIPESQSHANPVDSASAAERLVARLASGGSQLLVPEIIPLAVKKVAIDPGHGGIDGGTSLGYGMLEKDLTKDIANRLRQLLENVGCEVVMTRSDDEAVSLKERAEIANSSHADLFISIHINWLPNRNARGVETYYLGTTDDPFLTRLAAAENRDSGFSLADYRRLLEGIYADVRQAESRKLAEGVQQALYETLRLENAQISNRGVMTAPFVVLVATEMPAILAEVACLSNDREARLLAIPSYRQKIAEALCTGVSAYARAVNRAGTDVEKGS
jgi:N-acetylmuramoyl-L-alanine amidase